MNPARLVATSIALLLFTAFLSACQQSDDGPATTEELVDAATPSTVLVETLEGSRVRGSGSGWVIDPAAGLIATNFHVVAAGDRFKVSLEGEPLSPREATILAAAPCEDVAVLEVDDTRGLEALALAEQSELGAGERVVTLGFPDNASGASQLQVTEGVVSVSRTNLEAGSGDGRNWPSFPNLVQIDAALNPGNSGGPTINEMGELVGMNTFIGLPGQGYAIGSDHLRELLMTMEEGQSLGWGGFGFVFKKGFLIVTSVIEGSSAADAELAKGDLVLRLKGNRLRSFRDYCNTVGNTSGNTVKARVAFGDEYSFDIYQPVIEFE